MMQALHENKSLQRSSVTGIVLVFLCNWAWVKLKHILKIFFGGWNDRHVRVECCQGDIWTITMITGSQPVLPIRMQCCYGNHQTAAIEASRKLLMVTTMSHTQYAWLIVLKGVGEEFWAVVHYMSIFTALWKQKVHICGTVGPLLQNMHSLRGTKISVSIIT